MPSDPRARLVAYLCQAGLSTARANATLDDYAHGLAEVIREKSTELGNSEAEWFAFDRAADLIDPKVGAEA